MDMITREELPNLLHITETFTLRESVFNAQAVDGTYRYTFRELWSNGRVVVGVDLRYGMHESYSYAVTYVTELNPRDPYWRETGVTRDSRTWHGALRAFGHYAAPVDTSTLSAELVQETVVRLGL